MQGDPMSTAHIRRTSAGQIVEIPAELELPGEVVEIHREGNSLLITPSASWPKPKASTWQPLLDSLAMFPNDFMAEGQASERS